MNTPDSRTGQPSAQQNPTRPEQNFEHLKEEVTETLGDARQQADAQFGQYRDTAADQIEALARGAKSLVSEIESNDTLGLSDHVANMAENMSGLAAKLRNKSAEQLLHDGADLARNNPALFIAGSIAVGFGLSRFLKAGSAEIRTSSDPAAGSTSMPPSGGFGAQRPYETSVPSSAGPSPESATGTTPASSNAQDYPGDFATTSRPDSTHFKGEL
ncbi:hypothetical protein [Pseudomonas fluorescens]|uniref:Uncharacterized protein n=1 Tax=Pseudomonas fluorescens TaxID=294 RepID=A0A5E7F8R1_PSEFL|nr:hypothetical protein [Pseudomonas fluorescens]VVO35685.1 hypothetical protein PS691_05302 [Pseudomonas fluorescens]